MKRRCPYIKKIDSMTRKRFPKLRVGSDYCIGYYTEKDKDSCPYCLGYNPRQETVSCKFEKIDKIHLILK